MKLPDTTVSELCDDVREILGYVDSDYFKEKWNLPEKAKRIQETLRGNRPIVLWLLDREEEDYHQPAEKETLLICVECDHPVSGHKRQGISGWCVEYTCSCKMVHELEQDDEGKMNKDISESIDEANEARIQHVLNIDIPAWQCGSGDWFTVRLLGLIQKADLINRERIRDGFPLEVEAYERWESSDG